MVLIVAMLVFLSGLAGRCTARQPHVADELADWTDGAGQETCIWIDNNCYYGDSVENIAGEQRYIVYRGADYLILPDKIVVKHADNQ